MCFRKSLFISFFLFFLAFSLFLFSKSSLAADTCNSPNINGLCVPTEQMCQDNGGIVKPLTDFENQTNGCLNNSPCCTGGTTCASKGGVCGTSGSCNTNSNDITTFLCPGGTDNVCCVSKTSVTTPTTPDITLQSDSIGLGDYQSRLKGTNVTSWTANTFDDNIYHGLRVAGIGTSSNAITINGGILGITNKAIASLYNPPASGIEYLAQLKDNFLGKPVYAQQGTGFRGLQPILPIWRGFRNVVYILSSLVFIVAGIMIMLRVKISPQAIITVQSAIPQIIVTLILVTFSYAIAGLLIDLSYLIQNLFIGILFQTQGTNGLAGKLLDRNFTDYANGGLGMIFGLMWQATPFVLLETLGGIITGAIGGFVAFTAILGPGGLGAGVLGVAIGAALFVLILVIIIAIWLLKFLFGLIKCYVVIIFKIVLAPLEIGMGAFPNMKIGFSSWITDLIANLAVFPISYLFLIIANIIIDKTTYAPLWVPNLLSSNPTDSITALGSGLVKAAYAADPISTVAGLSGGIVPVCVGLATLALVSKLPQMIPEFIFQIKPSPWGKAIGEAYGKAPLLGGLYGTAKGGITEYAEKGLSGLLAGTKNRSAEAKAAREARKNQPQPGPNQPIQ